MQNSYDMITQLEEYGQFRSGLRHTDNRVWTRPIDEGK
jgi:hypothetical protein